MSRWSFHGRHASPYSSSPNRSPPVITDDDYTYMTPDDIVDPPTGFWSNSYRQSAYAPQDNPDTPDTLFVKYRNDLIPLRFPAFTVAEGFLKIGLIRRYTADKLRVEDVRRVKLRYKNKTLRKDDMAACDAGLKQNSELTCVITEAPSEDSESSGDEAAIRRGPRTEVDGTLYHDSGVRSNRTGGAGASRRDRDPSYSNSSLPNTPSRSGFPQPTGTSSANRPNPTPSSSGNDSRASPTPYTPPPGPRTTEETLQDILAVFNTKYRPLCQAFIDKPPTDSKARATEHTKLSETVLAQILLKLDDVQTDGNEKLRRLRKAAVQEAQDVLQRLDRAAGKSTKS